MTSNSAMMRFISMLLILFIITSCGRRGEKQATQKEESIKQEYLQKGGDIANLAQSELLRNVSSAIRKGGPGYAIDFCNMRALPLKDSLSRLNNCQIRRISFKYRNPLDMPRSKQEKEQLEQYQLASQKGESLKPEVYLFNDRIEYYQPIIIAMEACLQCHGDPGRQIAEETLGKIKERYPDDLAIGYKLNDFRGAWKITFMK